MSRGGLPRGHQGSLRTCLGCRAARAPELLVRVALAPEGVVADRCRRVQGRGAWVCPVQACATRASRHLVRALRLPPLEVPPAELWALLAGSLEVLGAGRFDGVPGRGGAHDSR